MRAAGVRLPADDGSPAPVTILDGSGRVVRVVSADEFRRDHGTPGPPTHDTWRRRKERVKTSGVEQDAVEEVAAP